MTERYERASYVLQVGTKEYVWRGRYNELVTALLRGAILDVEAVNAKAGTRKDWKLVSDKVTAFREQQV